VISESNAGVFIKDPDIWEGTKQTVLFMSCHFFVSLFFCFSLLPLEVLAKPEGEDPLASLCGSVCDRQRANPGLQPH
jgi:hypothetical protein